MHRSSGIVGTARNRKQAVIFKAEPDTRPVASDVLKVSKTKTRAPKIKKAKTVRVDAVARQAIADEVDLSLAGTVTDKEITDVFWALVDTLTEPAPDVNEPRTPTGPGKMQKPLGRDADVSDQTSLDAAFAQLVNEL